MSIVCILLSAVSVVLSLFYSSAATIQGGAVKELGSLPPEVSYAVVAAIFAIGGAFLLFKKKKFAAIPLFLASGVQAYANLHVETPYPYLLVSVALYAFAGLGSLFLSLKAGIEADIEEEISESEEKTPDSEPDSDSNSESDSEQEEESFEEDLNSESAPLSSEISESEIETEVFDDENASAETPSDETVETLPAEGEKEPKKKRRLLCPCGGPCLLLGILLTIAGIGISFHFSDVWNQIYGGSIKLTSLKEFLALDPLSSRVISAAAVALLATLFHLGRKTFSAILFFVAAGILASLQYGVEIEYPHWQVGIFLYLLAAFRAEYVGIDAMKNVPPRRYTWAYAYGFIFAIAASALALHQNGIFEQICASDGFCAFAETFKVMDGRTQTVVLISALGIFGGAMSLLMLPSASWILLGAMLLNLVAGIVCSPFYAYSWLVVLLLAIAGLCSASSVRIDVPLPVKRLTVAAAIFLMILAAFAGSAVTLYVTKGKPAQPTSAIETEIAQPEPDAETPPTEEFAEVENQSETEEKISESEDEPETDEKISEPEDESETDEEISEPEDEPASENDARVAELEKQLLMLLTESDAKIAELENQIEALAADGDEQVKNLTAQSAAKDEEIQKLNSAAKENDAKIAELEKQIKTQTTGSDEQVKDLTAQLAAKDEEIQKLNSAAAEKDEKISDLEKQIKTQTAGSDEQVKNLTAQSAAKDEEIKKLNSAAAEKDEKISDLEKQIKTLTAGSDEQVKNLTAQSAAKDEEIKKLNSAAKENEAKIAELEKQLKALTAGSDEQVKNLTAQSAAKDEEIKKLNSAAAEKDEKISELQYLLEAHKQRAGAATVRYICVRGRANVRNVPHANAGSKIISVIRDEIKEVLEVTHPEGSSGDWYKVEYSSGTGWVFGSDAVFPFEVKK